MIKENKFSILFILIILYLSLSNPQTFIRIGFFSIPYFDKLIHMGLYFTLMAIMISEHRDTLTDTRKLVLLAMIPFVLGIMIEFLQSGIAVNRKGDLLDVIFNSVGIALALFLWLLIKPYHYKEK